MQATSQASGLEDLEIELLLEGIYRHYGYDFRDYALSSVRRRVRTCVQAEKVPTISGLKEKILHDRNCLERFLLTLSINVTAMFRDPSFYHAFRTTVVPILRTYPFIRIWHAGCSTGEEVYSMAILMMEEGMYERCRIYATDMNDSVLRRARDGVFPLSTMKQYTENYIRAGGSRAFSDYYSTNVDSSIFSSSLKKNMVFAQHNLAIDGPFNEFHVIFCRNVMIYFNKQLQERVHHLFLESLIRRGFLGLGSKESLKQTPHESWYEPFNAQNRIYRRAR